jgi:hypothetical protein
MVLLFLDRKVSTLKYDDCVGQKLYENFMLNSNHPAQIASITQ